MKVEETLLALGWKQHPLDACLFMKYDEDGTLIGVMRLHVDDVLTCGHGCAYEEDIEYIYYERNAKLYIVLSVSDVEYAQLPC